MDEISISFPEHWHQIKNIYTLAFKESINCDEHILSVSSSVDLLLPSSQIASCIQSSSRILFADFRQSLFLTHLFDALLRVQQTLTGWDV